MVTISLCMIVKNEEDVLARCLDSAKDLVDEIIIVDTGSDDQTVEIAKSYTDKVFSFPWIDDFSAARNHSFSKATSDFIMWLDADDVIRQKDQDAFLAYKETLSTDVDVVMMKYDLAFDAAGNPTFSNFRERLMRREKGFEWVGPVHEVIAPVGNIVYTGHIAVSHEKLHPRPADRNLKIMEKHMASGGELDPRQTFYYGRELMDNQKWQESASVLEGYLRDDRGWLENRIEACRNIARCYTAMGKHEEALEALVKSFRFDTPRAETCCDLGQSFLTRKRHREAAYWYERARETKPQPERGGFSLNDSSEYTPCIQLCVCYDALGMREKAIEMNELAAGFKPGDASVAFNRKFFENAK